MTEPCAPAGPRWIGPPAAARRAPLGLEALRSRWLAEWRVWRRDPARWLSAAERLIQDASSLRGSSDDALLERWRRGVAPVPCAIEAIRRVHGLELHANQVAASLALQRGFCVELPTGEGKTLAAAAAALVLARAGRGVHLTTANDYLAGRDGQSLEPVAALLGLRVAAITSQASPLERRLAYRVAVTVTTHRELAADHLRDELEWGARSRESVQLLDQWSGASGDIRVMPPRAVAIVDEIDSVLIDDAAMPVILSSREAQAGGEPDEHTRQVIESADELAAELIADRRPAAGRGHGLLGGERALVDERFHGVSSAATHREWVQRVETALVARIELRRDEHYVVREGKAVIVDPATGRLAHERSWRAGLHAAVEAKEGVEIGGPSRTVRRITLQRYFHGYPLLAGLSGTVFEVRGELAAVHGLDVLKLPSHRPCIRKSAATRIATGPESKLRAVVREVEAMRALGRPVLVGTGSVRESQQLSAAFGERGLAHRVLNAHHDADEAEIVARAGGTGRVTIATNMAGRGTDIPLDDGVRACGGLHVILASWQPSRRLDRQLFGRSGRQGDPGSCGVILMPQDLPEEEWLGKLTLHAVRRLPRLADIVIGVLQRSSERQGERRRSQLMAAEERLDQSLTGAEEPSAGLRRPGGVTRDPLVAAPR